ncbi:cytochrome P450 2D6 isoform X3 [Apteryx mantelli]|uniref:Cytochrome P450 2D6 isoform X3 n=1 Tax=Apteryx mantelli TaxID=2696672 RepID=A0ABM4FPX2_9AVES
MALLLWLGSQLSTCWNNISILGIFLTVFTLLFDFMKRRKKWSHYPPGPTSLPFIGTMLHIDFRNPHLSFNQLHKKFGNVFHLQNCWTNLVVLNGYKTVKEALVHRSEDFADRPYLPMYEHVGYGSKSEGRPFDLRFLVNNAVCNVICTTIYGERFDYGDKTFKELLCLFENSLKEEAGFLPQLLNAVPILLRIPGVPQKVFRRQKEFMDFIDVLVHKHMENWNPDYIRDFTDAFLKEMEKGKVAEENGFNYNNLRLVTADLFAAGSETTSTTLRWAFLYMLLHPEIQNKVQAEIDKVIGRERSPTMEDQVNMPYTNAVIHEVQRYGDVIPIGLPHMTYRDIEFQGFFIPKGTTVITNLSSMLKDEAVWEKPNQFYPEHFLDVNGQFVKREAFMPFSAEIHLCTPRGSAQATGGWLLCPHVLPIPLPSSSCPKINAHCSPYTQRECCSLAGLCYWLQKQSSPST